MIDSEPKILEIFPDSTENAPPNLIEKNLAKNVLSSAENSENSDTKSENSDNNNENPDKNSENPDKNNENPDKNTENFPDIDKDFSPTFHSSPKSDVSFTWTWTPPKAKKVCRSLFPNRGRSSSLNESDEFSVISDGSPSVASTPILSDFEYSNDSFGQFSKESTLEDLCT